MHVIYDIKEFSNFTSTYLPTKEYSARIIALEKTRNYIAEYINNKQRQIFIFVKKTVYYRLFYLPNNVSAW